MIFRIVPIRRLGSGLAIAALLAGGPGCAARNPGGAGSSTNAGPERAPVFRPDLQSGYEDGFPDLDVRVSERAVVRGVLGENLLRIDFSFVSFRGYIGEDDVHASTGTLFLPVDSRGEARPVRFGEVLLTEFVPGSSTTGFPFHVEYGERPAVELGVAAAVVNVRGPIARELRFFKNPDDPSGSSFRGEEQFGYAMLRSYQDSGEKSLLYEHRVAQAWLRAIRAVARIVGRETGTRRHRFLLVGERIGALGAAQAAAIDPSVTGLVLCGWPVDWPDLHFTRWRRWERQAHWQPLAGLQPIPYRDSRELLSFLFSSYDNPDPGCPACVGTGDAWRTQYNLLDLERTGALDGVQTLFLIGDSDPSLPMDLEIRASVAPEAIATVPGPENGTVDTGGRIVRGAYTGPFAEKFKLPFDDLRYLRGSDSSLANGEAAEAALAWVQHLAGYRDVPRIGIREMRQDGDLVIEARVREGNASVVSVEVWLAEATGRNGSDFKHAMHRAKPEPVAWRRFDAIYSGHDQGFVGKWRAYLPGDRSRDRIYYVLVRDRVGALESAHSLPARPFWNLGDPAEGAARF